MSSSSFILTLAINGQIKLRNGAWTTKKISKYKAGFNSNPLLKSFFYLSIITYYLKFNCYENVIGVVFHLIIRSNTFVFREEFIILLDQSSKI